jgi:hypothetical protein
MTIIEVGNSVSEKKVKISDPWSFFYSIYPTMIQLSYSSTYLGRYVYMRYFHIILSFQKRKKLFQNLLEISKFKFSFPTSPMMRHKRICFGFTNIYLGR